MPECWLHFQRPPYPRRSLERLPFDGPSFALLLRAGGVLYKVKKSVLGHVEYNFAFLTTNTEKGCLPFLER